MFLFFAGNPDSYRDLEVNLPGCRRSATQLLPSFDATRISSLRDFENIFLPPGHKATKDHKEFF